MVFHLIHLGTDPLDLRFSGPGRLKSKQHRLSAIMILIFILMLEYRNRGMAFGWPSQDDKGKISNKMRLPWGPQAMIRKYHGYVLCLGCCLYLLASSNGEHHRPCDGFRTHLDVLTAGESNVHSGPSQPLLASPTRGLGNHPWYSGSLADRKLPPYPLSHVHVWIPLVIGHDAAFWFTILAANPQVVSLCSFYGLSHYRDMHLRVCPTRRGRTILVAPQRNGADSRNRIRWDSFSLGWSCGSFCGSRKRSKVTSTMNRSNPQAQSLRSFISVVLSSPTRS